MLAALNPLLLAQGRGLAREALTPLLAALLPLAGRTLRGPQREARVREEAVLQLRVQLAMRPPLADLATMTRWVLRELEAPHFCFWCVELVQEEVGEWSLDNAWDFDPGGT